MGLSTLSFTLLRRLSPSLKSGLTPSTSSFLSSRRSKSDSPPAARRLRTLKDLPPPSLADALFELQTPLSPSDLSQLAALIAADPAKLAGLVHLLTSPPPQGLSAPPRARLPRAWVAATLVRFGPPAVRHALSKRPDLVRDVAAVFDADPGKLDPAVATNAADVIRVLLHEFPKETASALHATPLIRRLVRHVALQPAADLLPRLVAHRVFSPVPFAPVVPMHKRAIAMLGTAHVQTLLARVFREAAEQMPHAENARRLELDAVMENAAAAMAEISNRAMYLARKHEDIDERLDDAYAGNIGIVTAHAFNDAKDHLTLLSSPQPLLDVVDAALNVRGETDALLPALCLVTNVLVGLREARHALLPSIRKAIKAIDVRKLGDGLVALGPQFAELLAEEGVVLGRRRLAVVDLIREMCETLPEACLSELLSADDDLLLRRLLAIGVKYQRNDVLQVRLAQMLNALFNRCEDLSVAILLRCDVLNFLVERRDAQVMQAPLASLVGYEERFGAAKSSPDQVETLAQLIHCFDRQKKELDSNELSGMRAVHAKSLRSDMIKELNLEGQLTANEDYGQELYLHHLLDEVSSGENQTPPSDTNVAQSAAEIAKGWGKDLSGRLKDAVQHAR